MQIETAMRYHPTPIRMATIKNKKKKKTGKKCWQGYREIGTLVWFGGGSVKWYSHYGK